MTTENVAILRQAIAESGGTEVKNLGDDLIVVFGSASPALACGMAICPIVLETNKKHHVHRPHRSQHFKYG